MRGRAEFDIEATGGLNLLQKRKLAAAIAAEVGRPLIGGSEKTLPFGVLTEGSGAV